jgi:hypothetical protein
MILELDLNRLKRNNLCPDQYVILFILYRKDSELAKTLFSLERAIELRDSLLETKFILDKTPGKKFFDTVISVGNVEKLLDIRSDDINFIDFLNEYPMKVGNRILRPTGHDTVQGKKLKAKYLLKIKNKHDHEEVIKATNAYVRKQKIAGNLNFLPGLEVVINNALWENWKVFIVPFGSEGGRDNTDSI